MSQNHKAKTVESCDLSGAIAARLFEALNPGRVRYLNLRDVGLEDKIISAVHPDQLVYPAGWYYAKGTFRNKHKSSTGAYSAIHMENALGDSWGDEAKYCTLYD